MEWFKTVFLPSLEERYKQNSKLWLTKKQASVCKRYMTPSNTVRGNYSITVDGKFYAISVAPNGCASFLVSAKF